MGISSGDTPDIQSLMAQVCGQYEVEKILKKKVENGVVLYRIKWVGYHSSKNTWEPAHHLTQEMLDCFEQQEKDLHQQKVKKEMIKKTARINPENLPITIESHFLNSSNELTFNIEAGGRKMELSRQMMLNRHGKCLGKYYIELAKKQGIY